MAQTITRSISIDVAQENRLQPIVAKQYDRASRFLNVQFLDMGTEMTIEQGATIVINAKRSDGQGLSFSGSVNSDGTVRVPITYWMLELDGPVVCDISIITGSSADTMLTSTSFTLEVQAAAVTNADVEENEDYPVLLELIHEVSEFEPELLDIRNGVHGQTFNSAGDAVRASAEQLYNMKTGFDGVEYGSPVEMVQTCDAEINEINQITKQFAEYGIADVPLHVGYWDATTGKWISSGTTYNSTRKIPVNGGDKIATNVDGCICIFYYADGTKKSFSSGCNFDITSDVGFVGIDVPLANIPSGTTSIQIVCINAFNEKVESIDTKADNTYSKSSVSLTLDAEKIIDNYGTVITYNVNDYKVSEAITVTPGDYYLIKGSANFQNSYYAIHDENDLNIIHKHGNSATTIITVNYIVRIPPRGKKLYVAQVGTNTASVAKITFDSEALVNLSATVEAEQEKLTAVKKAVDDIALPIYENATGETTTGYIFDDNGNKVSYLNGAILEASVTPYESIKVTAWVYGHQAYCVFYNGDGDIVGKANATGSGFQTITDEVLTVPSGAVSCEVVATSDHNIAAVQTVASYKSGAKWLGKKWVCVGDSLTEHNLRTTKNYHDYVAEATGITVVNMGMSGTGYMRQQDNNNAFYQRILNVPTDADVITIFGSGNDLSQPLGEVTDTGTTTICGCINTTFDNLYSVFPLAQIGVITPTPWIGNPPSNPNDAMSKYSAALVEICRLRGIPCLDLFHCSNLRPDDATFRQLAYSKDEGNGVHPDETGHKMIAPHFEAFLDTLLLS